MLGAMKQMQFDVGTINVSTFTANTIWVPPTNLIGPITALLVAGGGGGASGVRGSGAGDGGLHRLDLGAD